MADVIVSFNGATPVVINGAAAASAQVSLATAQATLAQAWAESAGEPGGVGTKSSKTWAGEAEASAASAAASALKPVWAGQRSGWPDPFFRRMPLSGTTFLGRDRWHGNNSAGEAFGGWTKVANPQFDGYALRRTGGYNTTSYSGPCVYLDEIGAAPGDTITAYLLIVGSGDVAYGSHRWLNSSGTEISNGLMVNAAGTNPITTSATPQWLRISTTVPANAARIALWPYCLSGSGGFDLLACWAFKGGTADGPEWPSGEDAYFSLRDTEIETRLDGVEADALKPNWTGKLNGWPDPFFRAFDPAADSFLGRSRWYQSVAPNGPGWTKVKNAVFDGYALRRTAGYNQTTRSGPTIWLDELGAVPGDTITLYVLVIDPAAAGGTVYCQYQFSQDSPFSTVGGAVIMLNVAGTPAGVVADATPKFMRSEVVVPASATRVQLIPYNVSGATGFDLIAVWAFKGTIADGPKWPTLTDNYFGLRDAEITNPTPDLRAWLRAEAYTVTSTISYNAFGRPVSPLNIVWPDGKAGVLTITYNTDGTVASLSATYAGTPARTVAQPTITYSRGVPTAIPAITVS